MTPFPVVRRASAAAVLAALLVLPLSACTITTSDKPAVTPVNPLDPDPTGTTTGTAAPQGPDIQLRPVLAVRRATQGDCGVPAPSTPPPDDPATLCSADLAYVLDLGEAALDGTRVRSIDAGSLDQGPSVRVTLDQVGATALSNVTLRISQKSSPENLLAIVTHGRVQSAPLVDDQITGGVLDITGFATLEDARAAAALFGG